MLKPLATRFLQHICSQNTWSREYFLPFAGKVVQMQIGFIKANLLILEDGSLSIAGETHAPDAIIHAPTSLMLRMMAGDDSAKMQIKIEGESHLGAEFGKILQLMRWDIEEDLSQVVGDIAANKTIASAQKISQEAKKQSLNAAQMLTEFWQEEKPILAKKTQVEQFNQQVDTLRSDTARLEKRLTKLTKAATETKESPAQ